MNMQAMGVTEMERGDSKSFLEALRATLSEFATLMLLEKASTVQKSKELAKMLLSFKNTMTDRHIVNKKIRIIAGDVSR